MRAARFRSRVQLGDPILFFLVVGLSCLGIAKVYSAGVLDVPSTIVAGLWRMQLLWFSLALLLIPIVLKVPIQIVRLATVPLYVLAMILLSSRRSSAPGSGPPRACRAGSPSAPSGCRRRSSRRSR
jgi:cell division protein FtsW (lipid II flippase)